MAPNIILPLALLFLGLRGAKKDAPASGPTTPEGRKLEAKLAVALAKKEAARKPRPKPQPSAAPRTESDAAAQAAVDAAVHTALTKASAAKPPSPEEVKLATALAKKEAAIAADAPNAPPTRLRSPKEAAAALRAFLQKTHRFGSKAHPEEDVRAAQRDLGVAADGIVGPVTRAASKKAGVTLPAK